MLRFVLLCLILAATVATFETKEGSANYEDDEDGDFPKIYPKYGPKMGSAITERSQGEEGSSTTIIIAAVSVVAVAVAAVIAIFLFRRHLQIREQGVYTVPAEQAQKAAV
ncbi:uncharacterized protein LOC143477468 [Brachyhypopomus gauderio]|uniref:uncharacterized protein LOC143477468 n=1 Tax=Brachyhypopomus gauderio TaxID=698409 RepID=UPI0040437F8C